MKLLHKTIRTYFIVSLIILLAAIPVFYFAIQQIVREDMNEELIATRDGVIPKLKNYLLSNNVQELKLVDPNILITSSSLTTESDSLTTVDIYDNRGDELVPHRVLTSHRILNGKPIKIVITTSLVDNDNLISSIVAVEVILLFMLLAGLAVINRKLSKNIWQPFYNTLRKLQNYTVENTEPLALEPSGIDEFNDLQKSLEELTQRTKHAYLGQKEFAENASHEMQTPLAVFQGKLELLMQTAPLSETQAELIGDLADASQRMARLNKSLLLLAKIENKQFPANEKISLDNIIRHYIQQYEPQVLQKQLTLNYSFNSDTILDCNKTLLEILVDNLIGNAIRHNNLNGSIIITLQPGTLTIQNTGVDSKLNEQRIFSRFQKDSTDVNSLGLGLEIVKKICVLYNFKISYSKQEDLHTFLVFFA
jgi:signal transduction histidine kinase